MDKIKLEILLNMKISKNIYKKTKYFCYFTIKNYFSQFNEYYSKY